MAHRFYVFLNSLKAVHLLARTVYFYPLLSRRLFMKCRFPFTHSRLFALSVFTDLFLHSPVSVRGWAWAHRFEHGSQAQIEGVRALSCPHHWSIGQLQPAGIVTLVRVVCDLIGLMSGGALPRVFLR